MKLNRLWLAVCCLLLCTTGLTTEDVASAEETPTFAPPDQGTEPNVRRFHFVYGATIKDLLPGATARVWLPLATTDHSQKIARLRTNLPGNARETVEQRYGNHLLYFEAKADQKGQIPIEITYLVERHKLRLSAGELTDEGDTQKFLGAARNVPVDGSLLKRFFRADSPVGDPVAVARSLYSAVDDHMRYDKPVDKPWGRGDAAWACDSGFGNCSDFHSLFIGLCRDLEIPAKFEIGFPIPSGSCSGPVEGYHCWAMFSTGERWVAVDISEADQHPEIKEYYFGNLTADRVAFTTGRDLVLDPPQTAGPVNFLVYPYVEVNGRAHTAIEKRFRYENID